MRAHDLGSSTVLFLVGLFIVLYAPRFGLGSASTPGPGFMPFLAGFVILAFSAATCARAFFSKEGGSEKVWADIKLRKIVFSLLLLVLYALLFEKIGFIVCTFFLILFLIHYGGSRTWGVSILSACATSSLSYLLFVTWLKTELPRGIIGF